MTKGLAPNLRRQRGMTLVELMVGMVVGLALVATTIYFLVGFGAENRRTVLETRLSQDMRAAMDTVTRDVRRAGYWQNAKSAYAAIASSGPVDPNVVQKQLACMVVAQSFASAPASGSTVTYAYSKDADNVASTAETYGVRLNGDVLQMNLGSNNFQDLTDPQTTKVTAFSVAASATALPMGCAASCPTLQIREYTIVLTAQAANDATVQRTLRSTVRLRNDLVVPASPPASGTACL